ncbi:hypothetical protein P8C59_004281 [Phyllachora maydis]|uniref:Uncharacterized protein n=1 Tax=Phyllachora maydis TaxID=1825666 RepID=A0AAD9I3S1_9PEZI|nr:hypothetical protein P8C59_004281 [Phyllachora maydis]
MADQAKGKGITPKRASNPADPGQSSRPLLPIRTLLEDKEDGEDYSEVIEVLKQHIKSHKRVIASQSSDRKTLLLSLNTLKASVKDSVSAIKNISSTLASLTNSSNAAATTIGKTSYSPRFDPFSGTIDLDSPPRPPRKEPYLGPAVNSATSNLDPPIDIGSKEGFKDTITSSIVKELSKKAYTIPDDKNPNISNTYSDSDQAVLLMLLHNSLSSSPRATISPLKAVNKAPKCLGYSFSTYLTTTTATTTTTITSAANPATTITAIRSSDISFDSLFKGLSSTPAPTPTKPAKITPAICRIAACKAKRREAAKAYATAGRAAAAKRRKKRKEAAANAWARKLAKKEGLRRSKRTAGSNAGRYTTDSGLTANKDDNNAYNRAYIPPADIEEEEEKEGGSSDNNGINSGTSNSTDKGKGSSMYKRSKGSLYYKDILLYKQ